MAAKQKAFDWQWKVASEQSILLVTFQKTPMVQDWRTFHAEAYADFAGGPVKLLSDSRLSENIVDHDGLITLYDDASHYGVTERFIANVVNDSGYFLKSDMINKFSRLNNRPLGFKSFLEPEAAMAWLLSCSFDDLIQTEM